MSRKPKPDPNDPGAANRVGLFAWLRSRFFAGIVVTAPIAITVWVVVSLINFVDSSVRTTIEPLIPPAWNPETYTRFAIPGFGVIVAVLALTLIGTIAANLIGRSVIGAADRVVGRLPVVRNIYSALKQLIETVASNQKSTFKEVVLIEYPKTGTWCIGFLTSDAQQEVAYRLGVGMVGVFVPTTPNPTSGFLMYVNASEVIKLDMSVEDGAKMIVSAGLVVPEYAQPPVNDAVADDDDPPQIAKAG